jgi:hypothetical protein
VQAIEGKAPRYHLGVDEVPAILQRGERVIPRGQNDNRSAATISFGDINITLPEGTTTENAAAVGQVVAPIVAAEVRKVLATESRARGMLNRAY